MVNTEIVALNMSNLSVPDFILKSRLFIKSLAEHKSVFKKPKPSLKAIGSAAQALENAWEDAADGGKTKKAEVLQKKRALYALLKLAAQYVQEVSKGDETVILLSSLSVKRKAVRVQPMEFQVFLPDDLGAVGLKCRARKKSVYRWEFCKLTGAEPEFGVHHYTDVSTTFIGDLESNVIYWFRVVLINKFGEHALDAKSITPL